MDRLPALIGLAAGLAAVACSESTPTKASNNRVAKVEAAPARDPAEVAKEWCDAQPTGQKFSYPALAAGTPQAPGKSRWINIWATWCQPCVEELPRIGAFRDKLPSDGARVELELLSADDDVDAFAGFVAKNPAAKASLRVAAPDDVSAWLTSLGLDGEVGLPLHLFVDAQDNLRCVRLGGVGKEDYDNVLAVIRTMI